MSDETALIKVEDNPQHLMRRATDVAGVCREIVLKTAVNIQGKKYVKAEGWMSIATAHGCIASSRAVERIEGGYRAIGEIRRISDGLVLATAEGFVGDDETNTWGKRPEYARRAMAQTRAISRACRAAFAHVVVLMDAGLSTTPAEEVPENGFVDVEVVKPQPKPAPQQETPEQKKAKFLKWFAPYGSYATELFRATGLVLDTEDYTSISPTKLESMTGHQVNLLLADVRKAAGAADQIPNAEVTEPLPQVPAADNDEPVSAPEGTESVVGKLMAISKKEGKGNNGKPWTRYGIMLQDGDNKQWINTFDKKLADVAASLKGQEVEAFVKRNDKGFMDLVGFA